MDVKLTKSALMKNNVPHWLGIMHFISEWTSERRHWLSSMPIIIRSQRSIHKQVGEVKVAIFLIIPFLIAAV